MFRVADPTAADPSGPSAEGPATPLRVRTVPLEGRIDPSDHIPPDATAAWIHGGRGMVAVGRAAEHSPRGAERFSDAAAWFSALAQSATVDDEVHGSGTGLVAFASFAFADDSQRPSILTVPRAVLGVDHGTAWLTVITRADEDDEHAARLLDTVEAGGDAWRDLFQRTPHAQQRSVTFTDLTERPAWNAAVGRAVARLRAHDLEKVVLARRVRAESAQRIEAPALAAELTAAYPTTWTFLVGDMIGASPEMLVQAEGRRAFSRVLAGTLSPGTDGTISEEARRRFLADPKELSEHAFARDSVLERLAPLCEGVDTSPEPFLLRLPNVEHLASDVFGALSEGVTLLDAVARLHPSAAVAGTPRSDALALISELEPHDRGLYAGPVGWLDATGNGQFALALRSARLTGTHSAELWAGCGIMPTSVADREWEETVAKTAPLRSALQGRRD